MADTIVMMNGHLNFVVVKLQGVMSSTYAAAVSYLS